MQPIACVRRTDARLTDVLVIDQGRGDSHCHVQGQQECADCSPAVLPCALAPSVQQHTDGPEGSSRPCREQGAGDLHWESDSTPQTPVSIAQPVQNRTKYALNFVNKDASRGLVRYGWGVIRTGNALSINLLWSTSFAQHISVDAAQNV